MGYEYELLVQYAEHLGVNLEIKMSRNAEDFYKLLDDGQGDIISWPVIVETR